MRKSENVPIEIDIENQSGGTVPKAGASAGVVTEGGGAVPKAEAGAAPNAQANAAGGPNSNAAGGPDPKAAGGPVPKALGATVPSQEPEAKRARTGSVMDFAEPWAFTLHWSLKEVKLESKDPENKRLKKHFCFASWTSGAIVNTSTIPENSPTHFAYSVAPGDLVLDVKSQSMQKLSALMKTTHAKSIFGFKGAGPTLANADTFKCAVTLDEEDVALLTIARASPGLLVAFAFKFDSEKKVLNLFSVGVYLEKMTTFAAMNTHHM